MLGISLALLLVGIISMQVPSNAEAIPCNNTFLGMIEVFPGTNGVENCWKRRGVYDGRYLIYSSQLNVCENDVLKMQGVEIGTEQFFDLNSTNFNMRFPKCDESVEDSKYLPYMTMYYTNHHKFCLFRILVATEEYNVCDTALPPSTLLFENDENKCHNRQHKVLITGVVLSVFYVISVMGLLFVIYHLKRSGKSGDRTAFVNFDELQRNEKNTENNNSKKTTL